MDSVAILATAQDSLNDVFATGGILLSILLEKTFQLPLDGYVGAVVSLLVLYSGWGLIQNTLSPLLGEAPKEELVHLIEREILSFHESIIGIHDLVVHQYGVGKCFATVHVELPSSESVTKSHDIVDRIELYFEERDIEGFIQKLEELYPDTVYVNRLMTHSWGQRVVRFYDPDGNLIEVGTPME